MHKCDPDFFAEELAAFLKKPSHQAQNNQLQHDQQYHHHHHQRIAQGVMSTAPRYANASSSSLEPERLAARDRASIRSVLDHGHFDDGIAARPGGSRLNTWRDYASGPASSYDVAFNTQWSNTYESSVSSGRISLTEDQRSLFVQQLCFLRIYDKTVDQAFDRLERTSGGMWGVFNSSIFAEIEALQKSSLARKQHEQHVTHPSQSASGDRIVTEAATVPGVSSSLLHSDSNRHEVRPVMVDVISQRFADVPAVPATFNQSITPSHAISRSMLSDVDGHSPAMASPESINFSPTDLSSGARPVEFREPAVFKTPTSSLFSTPGVVSNTYAAAANSHPTLVAQEASVEHFDSKADQKSVSVSMRISHVVD